jgi:ADP-glucose pyrophosphorylase
VEILAAEQTLADETWYQGTADAVRKNLGHFQTNPFDYMLILSGDQLYRMDYRVLFRMGPRSEEGKMGNTRRMRSRPGRYSPHIQNCMNW